MSENVYWNYSNWTSPPPVPAIPEARPSLSIDTVVEQCIAAKRESECREIYIVNLKRTLDKFSAAHKGIPINAITPRHISHWLTCKGAKSTRTTNMYRLSTLFMFAYRRDYIDRNPVDRIDRIRSVRRAPQILTPAQATRLVEYTCENMPELLAYITIGLYAAVRAAEIRRIDWSCLDLQRGLLIIDAAASKVRTRRLIYLHPKAVALLSRVQQPSGKIVTASQRATSRFLPKAGRAAGLPGWSRNLLRHSGASFLLALHGDAGKVALMLGNSPGILLTFYTELVRKEDCAAFWDMNSLPIMPLPSLNPKHRQRVRRASWRPFCTGKSRNACAAAEAANGAPKGQLYDRIEAIAATFKVHPRWVRMAHKVQKERPDLYASIKAGKVSVNYAYRTYRQEAAA